MNRHDGPLTCKSERIREVGCAMRGSGSSSPARVIPRGFVCVLPLLSICVVFMVQPAVAATWPVSTSGLSATLAFHQSYTAGIESYVHSGIDIPASAGMQISSPLAGTVRFTGTVPSGRFSNRRQFVGENDESRFHRAGRRPRHQPHALCIYCRARGSVGHRGTGARHPGCRRRCVDLRDASAHGL